MKSDKSFIFKKLEELYLAEINDNKLQRKLIYKEFGFDVFNSEVKSQIDVIVCMNGEFMQRNFAINLVDINHKIYEKSEGKITGILLEKSKKKYYNIDIDILIKSLLLTFEEIITDKK
ncbi:MAG: hypothetical protein RBR65_00515 [Aliarcobacter sp.]|nr:hypothetical protein [Aliarcobacter sp.]